MAESVSGDTTRHAVATGDSSSASAGVSASDATVAPLEKPAARVLLADVDVATLKAVAVTLRQEGRVIVTASDGVTALALLTDGAFDLVVTDVRVVANGESLLAQRGASRPASCVSR